MATSNTCESYLRDVVSRVTHDDSQSVEAAIELMLLTDCSTPLGAAAHGTVMSLLYEYTDDRVRARDNYFEEVKERLRAIQVSASQ